MQPKMTKSYQAKITEELHHEIFLLPFKQRQEITREVRQLLKSKVGDLARLLAERALENGSQTSNGRPPS